MNIVVLTGSPHRNGTTSVLTEEFIKGAESKGHNVFRFDAAFHDIHPCQGCDACGMNGPCVQKDDIENDLIMRLVDADLIALISPVYYWHVSAQLKTCIDRFYARTGRISGKQSVLLAAAGSDVPWAMDLPKQILRHTLELYALAKPWHSVRAQLQNARRNSQD